MVIYNVTIKLDKAIEQEWLDWMRNTHIPDVMNTGHFISNKILRLIGGEDESGVTYAVQYTCPDLKTLHQYQIQDASRLQKDHTEKYQGKFAAFRTILEEV